MRLSHRTIYAFLLVLLLAAGVRLLTFERFLPYNEYPDEPSLFLMGQDWRGVRKTPASVDGYPPAYIWINGGFQVVIEALIPNRWIPPWEYYRALRLLAALASLVTTAFVIQFGWQLGSWFRDSKTGQWVGILTGLLWALSPTIVDNGSLAVADPFVYLFCATALWLAVIALRYRRIRALVGCLVACILAIYAKYSAVFVLITWGMAALYLLWLRVGRYQWWIGQGAFAVLSAGYLVFGNKAFALSNREANAIRYDGLSLMFTPSRVLNNLDWTLRTIGAPLLITALLLGGIAFLVRQRRMPNLGSFVWLLLILALYCVAGILISAGFIFISDVSMLRHTLPVVIALCGLVSCAIIFGITALSARWLAVRRIGYTAVLALVMIPNLTGIVGMLKQYSHPDTRYVLWQWTDASLPAYQMILVHPQGELERVWNRDWSGYDGVKDFHWWWTTSDTPKTSISEYIQKGIGYFGMSEGDRVRLYNTPEMKAWIEKLWLIKTFQPDPDQPATPKIYFYRLERPQVSAGTTFSEQLHLIGYDASFGSEQIKAGDTLRFRPYWQTDRRPESNYSMFTHLYAEGGTEILAQQDGSPGTAQRLTLQWDDPDEVHIGDEIQLKIPANIPPGNYQLRIGLYNFTTGVRLQTREGADHFTIPFTVVQ